MSIQTLLAPYRRRTLEFPTGYGVTMPAPKISKCWTTAPGERSCFTVAAPPSSR